MCAWETSRSSLGCLHPVETKHCPNWGVAENFEWANVSKDDSLASTSTTTLFARACASLCRRHPCSQHRRISIAADFLVLTLTTSRFSRSLFHASSRWRHDRSTLRMMLVHLQRMQRRFFHCMKFIWQVQTYAVRDIWPMLCTATVRSRRINIRPISGAPLELQMWARTPDPEWMGCLLEGEPLLTMHAGLCVECKTQATTYLRRSFRLR